MTSPRSTGDRGLVVCHRHAHAERDHLHHGSHDGDALSVPAGNAEDVNVAVGEDTEREVETADEYRHDVHAPPTSRG